MPGERAGEPPRDQGGQPNGFAIKNPRHLSGFNEAALNSPLFELARVRVHFDHVASRIVNANHSIM